MKHCPNCTAPMEENDKVCSYCEEALPIEMETPKEPSFEMPVEEEKREENIPVEPSFSNTELEPRREIPSSFDQTTYPPKNKSSLPLIIIMAITIITLGCVTLYLAFFHEEEEEPKQDPNTEEKEEKEDKEKEESKNTYRYGGYQFTAPEDWKFTINPEGMLVVYPKLEEEAIAIQILDSSYTSVELSLDQIEQNWKNSGYEISEKMKGSKNNRDYYIYDTIYSGYKGYIVLTDLGEKTLCSVILAQKDNAEEEYYDEMIDIVTNVLEEDPSIKGDIEQENSPL